MERFRDYLAIARLRGSPYWTPVATFHRLFSFFISYGYCAARLTPLTVTLIGLASALAGFGLLAWQPLGGPWFAAGLALLNLGVLHDACDGEVARYRIHHKLQSPASYRVGIFADFWVFTVVIQALLPAALGYIAWQRTGLAWPAALGVAAALTLLAAYVAAFARKAFWPGRSKGPLEQSVSLAEGGSGLVRLARAAYFWVFETAMFTTHATLVLAAWTLLPDVAWLDTAATAYAGFAAGAIAAAFLVGLVQTFRRFDLEE